MQSLVSYLVWEIGSVDTACTDSTIPGRYNRTERQQTAVEKYINVKNTSIMQKRLINFDEAASFLQYIFGDYIKVKQFFSSICVFF